MCAFRAVNYFSLSYIVLALSSAVTNLSNKTLIFHDLPWPAIEFHDFPGLENEILKFHDFPGFPWPVRNLDNVLWLDMTSTQKYYQGLLVKTREGFLPEFDQNDDLTKALLIELKKIFAALSLPVSYS